MPTCLRHRCFAKVDAHAAKRHTKNSLEALAQSLTSPFRSHTDKARVIYTWLHHNISFDCQELQREFPKSLTAWEVLKAGKAVCSGYSKLFQALAICSGLQAEYLWGHYKVSELEEGRVRMKGKVRMTHAWNAVRIDKGEWWLIDCTWGAGYLSDKDRRYTKFFNPEYFVATPKEFGRRHWPTDRRWLLCDTTWSEFREPDKPGPVICSSLSNIGFIGKTKYITPRQFKGSGRYEVSLTMGPCECLPYDVPLSDRWRVFVYVGKTLDKNKMAVMTKEGRRWTATIDVGRRETVRVAYVQLWSGRCGKGLSKNDFLNGIGKVRWRSQEMVRWN
ncbi:hypothetical protein BZA77DRAFT_242270 [Pyronema omphalodes]|nr:hypothetical protein BZA77DRAFT_242270 [Pyronema omphalodes]